MRWIHVLVAGLLVASSVPCHIAWAQPGAAALDAHAAPPGSHGASGHSHAGAESAPDSCEIARILSVPSETVTAPQPVAFDTALPWSAALAPPRPPVPWAFAILPVLPVTPVHRSVVLII